ncbi:unnamed protein product [Ectocarpus sp. CCAP 1310/34]|nr:unnamed protein product [Ectocarpus sp. CCAP 1310/34]
MEDRSVVSSAVVGASIEPVCRHVSGQNVCIRLPQVAQWLRLVKFNAVSVTMPSASTITERQTAQASLGFHMAPWTLVPHLHMHAIAPLRSLNIWQRFHFLVGSFW